MATAISFDSNNLQTANIQTSDINHEQIPSKIVSLYPLAHANASKLAYTGYTSKTIKIKGMVTDTSVAALDSRLDTFRAYFNGESKNLDIGYGSGTRRYIATVNGLAIDRPGGLAYANFEVEFIATQPFGQDTIATTPTLSPSGTGRTLSTYTDSYTFLGSAPFQLPVVTITLTAVTGATNQTIVFTNGGNGQGITVTRTWAASDVLVIDSVNKAVTVNGAAVSFSGAFPEFPPGPQSFFYLDSFTTRTFNISITYNVMYQ